MKCDVAKSTNIRQNACRWRMIQSTHTKNKIVQSDNKKKRSYL